MKNPDLPPSAQKTIEAVRILHDVNHRIDELDIAALQRAHHTLGQAIVEAQKEALADCFDFGEALERMKNGKRVSRRGWNGKNAWIFVTVPAVTVDEATHGRPIVDTSPGNLDGRMLVHVAPAIAMRTAKGETIVGWLASQADMLADDWFEIRAVATMVNDEPMSATDRPR
jgi:hypothetical protein